MRLKSAVMVPLWLLACACTQSAVLGDGNGGGGGAGAGPATGGGGAAPLGGNGSGEGGSTDAMALGAAVCEAREACETVEADCAHDTGCIFTIFRTELHAALETCLSACGAFDDCWQTAVDGSTPPDEFAQYVSECNQSGVDCEGDPDAMGHDWCEYDFFTAENYAAMVDCFDVSCSEVNNCLRGVVFAVEPSCYDF
jgi:hypothetical protein